MRNHTFSTIASIMASLVLSLIGCNKEKQDPVSGESDLVVYGNIYTAVYSPEGKSAMAEAVAIKDGKFEYVGSADGVKGISCRC